MKIVTVELRFWRRNKQNPKLFDYLGKTIDIEMGIGYEDRLNKIILDVQKEGWKLSHNGYKITTYKEV